MTILLGVLTCVISIAFALLTFVFYSLASSFPLIIRICATIAYIIIMVFGVYAVMTTYHIDNAYVIIFGVVSTVVCSIIARE